MLPSPMMLILVKRWSGPHVIVAYVPSLPRSNLPPQIVIGLLLHSLRPPSFQYIMPYSLSLQFSWPSMSIVVPPHHRIFSIFRLLWVWPVLCPFCLDVLQKNPCIILENYRLLPCLSVRIFFHSLLFSFWHLKLCSYIVYLTLICTYLCIQNCCCCCLCQ